MTYLTRRRNTRNKVDPLDITGLDAATTATVQPLIDDSIDAAITDEIEPFVADAIATAIAAAVAALPASAPPVVQASAQVSNFNLTSAHNRYRFPCTAALTITVPSAASLGTGFECWVHSIGFTTTINGVGVVNPTVTTGQGARIFTLNDKVYTEIRTAADYTDIS